MMSDAPTSLRTVRPWGLRRLGWLVAAATSALLAGCAPPPGSAGEPPLAGTRAKAMATPPDATAAATAVAAGPGAAPNPPPGPGPAASRPPAEPATGAPLQRNHTDAPSILLMGQDGWGTYYSALLKISYSANARGELALAPEAEPTIDHRTPEDRGTSCHEHGAALNQRTTWFPDTGLLVRGGTLRAVHGPTGQPLPLLRLSTADRDLLLYTGKDARQVEMAYVPCVGPHRVATGHRSIGFVEPGSTLTVVDAKGRLQRLRLPGRPLPFVLLRYHSGAMIPSPMRVVLVTVDLLRQRVVLQFQSTFMTQPPLRVVEWRALPVDVRPSEGETLERARERDGALANDLAACPPPLHPPEACATPLRRPDLRIFVPS